MLLKVLAFLPCIARLIDDLAKAQNETLLLQDRLQSALNDRERVWKEMQEARLGQQNALHMLINIEYQRHYGIAPYPDAVKLPPAQEPGGPVTQRLTASQAVAAHTERLIRDLVGRKGVPPNGADST